MCVNKKLILVVLMASVFAGCSHTPREEAQLESRLQNENEFESYSGLESEIKSLVEGSTELNEAKKKRLIDLKINTVRSLEQFQKEILKNKSVLLTNILSERYSKKEVRLIEKKIIELSQKKNESFFQALEEAKEIVSGVKEDNVEKAASQT